MPATLTPITGDGTVPTGGAANQVLQKSSSTNYAYAWASLTAGGNVSTSGTITTGQHARWASATTLESITAATAKTDLSLNNVTNDAQTQAAVVPNTSPAGGEILVGTGLGPYVKRAVSGSGATIALASTGIMTISAIADSAITSSGTWNTASSERRQWDGSSTNLVAATGRTSLGIGDAVVYENASAAGATLSTSNIAIPGSVITVPAGSWAQGGQYHCAFDVTKSAGAAGIIITLHMGTAGTTSDAAITTFTWGAGAAIADSGVFDIYATFKTVGSGTSAVVVMYGRLTRSAAAAGLVNGTNPIQLNSVTSAGFASTTQTKISLGFNGGASFAGTNLFSQAQYMQ